MTLNPFARPLRLQLISRGGIFGKTLLQFARIPLGLFALVFVILLLRAWSKSTFPAPFDPVEELDFSLDLWNGFTLVTAYIMGLAVTVEEEEEGTSAFLLQLPIRPSRLILNQILASVVLFFGFILLFLPSVYWVVGLDMGMGDYLQKAATRENVEACLTAFVFGGMIGSWLGYKGMPFAAMTGFALFGSTILVSRLLEFSSIESPDYKKFFEYIFGVGRNETSLLGFTTIPIALACSCFWYWREYSRQLESPFERLVEAFRGIENTKQPVEMVTPIYAHPWYLEYQLLGKITIVLLISILFLVPPFVHFADLRPTEFLMLGGFLGNCLIATCLGALSCHPLERYSINTIPFGLPGVESRRIGRRLFGLGLSAVLLSSVIVLILHLSFWLGEDSLVQDGAKNSWILLLLIPASLGASWIGYLLRLFHKSFMVAVVLGILTNTVLQTACLFVNNGPEDWILRFWSLGVLLAFPLCCIWFATQRTLVLEWNDKQRLPLGILVIPWILIWMVALITMHPYELAFILWYGW
ncbi:MAG: hypothetical protein SFY68_14035 [Candidatus Sumerlaeia bacterium]|nr:hypothetical protein [Candidatus Sumerlaeia bacterium]